VRIFFDTSSLVENLVSKWGCTNHGGGIFASQTGSPVHDTCSNFIRHDFLYIIFETQKLGNGSCLYTKSIYNIINFKRDVPPLNNV